MTLLVRRPAEGGPSRAPTGGEVKVTFDEGAMKNMRSFDTRNLPGNHLDRNLTMMASKLFTESLTIDSDYFVDVDAWIDSDVPWKKLDRIICRGNDDSTDTPLGAGAGTVLLGFKSNTSDYRAFASIPSRFLALCMDHDITPLVQLSENKIMSISDPNLVYLEANAPSPGAFQSTDWLPFVFGLCSLHLHELVLRGFGEIRPFRQMYSFCNLQALKLVSGPPLVFQAAAWRLLEFLYPSPSGTVVHQSASVFRTDSWDDHVYDNVPWLRRLALRDHSTFRIHQPDSAERLISAHALKRASERLDSLEHMEVDLPFQIALDPPSSNEGKSLLETLCLLEGLVSTKLHISRSTRQDKDDLALDICSYLVMNKTGRAFRRVTICALEEIRPLDAQATPGDGWKTWGRYHEVQYDYTMDPGNQDLTCRKSDQYSNFRVRDPRMSLEG
ncbi:hypothetical protein QBC35DRAFT_531231 [Podospora australis]|uniref:Uncharacterized protein n=1 Tax=Podospora australis TaxID=1536484 RepID=A0AAN6WVY0_9PEZI|nr:hypothetical protein QBC35DRAFT_531231 [Podospora australis]